VDFVDDCIGELLAGLESSGQLENTIIIYSSDHGEMNGLHGLWGKKVYYDPSVRVPLLITGPGVHEGHHRLAQPISLIDLYPTVCGLTGLPVPEGLDGVDFSGLLARPASGDRPRRYASSAYYSYGVRIHHGRTDENEPCAAMRLVRDSRWKYVEVERGRPLLFDLEADPGETRNLAGRPEHGERGRAMAEAVFDGFSWELVHAQLAEDRRRLPEFLSGLKPTTPNQYLLPDGRMFDAEASLYEARWLAIPPGCTAGIIPQEFG